MKAFEILTESREPGEYVYHASYLPNTKVGLASVLKHGLLPSINGYSGPGVYFSYTPDGGFYHVDKEQATLFRVKWADLVKLFGVYPENSSGIERTPDEIIVPGAVPADMLEVEYFENEWWPIDAAFASSNRPDLEL